MSLASPVSPRLPFAIAVSLIALASISACTGDPEVLVNKATEEARQASAQGNPVAAAQQYRQALQIRPENAGIRLELATTYVELNESEAALKELDKAEQYGIGGQLTVVPRARALLQLGRQKEIIDQIVAESIDQQDPPELDTPQQQATLFALRGHAFLADGNFDNAGYWYGRAEALEPESAEALLGRAAIARARNDPAAPALIDRITEIAPGFAPGWSLRGDYLRSVGSFAPAEAAFTRAIELRFYNWPDVIKRGFVHLSMGQVDEAEKDFQLVKGLGVNTAAIEHGLGLVKSRRGDDKGAIADFEKAVARDPDYLPVQFHLGSLLFQQGELEQANFYLSRFANAAPENREAVMSAVAAKLRVGDFAPARKLISAYLLANPDDVGALTVNALVHSEEPDPEKSVELLRQIVDNNSDSVLARVNLGVGHLKVGDPDKAVTALREAVALEQDSTSKSELLLIRALLQAQRYDEAYEEAQRLVEGDPDNAGALVVRALASLGKGDENAYRDTMLKALDVDPGNPFAANALARDAISRGELKEAKGFYKQLLNHDSAHMGALLGLAEIEFAMNRVGAALPLLERAMASHPQALVPRAFLARAAILNGRPARAIELLSEIEPLYSDNAELLNLLGKAYADAGQPQNALNVYEKWARIPPETAGKHYLLAQAYSLVGDEAGLRAALEQSLALNPSSPEALASMVRLATRDGQRDRAEQLLASLETSAPNSLILWDLRGDLAVRIGDLDDAVGYYKVVYERSPGSSAAVKLAQSMTLAGDSDAAVALLGDRWASHPDELDTAAALADLRMARSDDRGAAEVYRRIVAAGRDTPAVLNNLAWALRNAEPAEALKFAERAATQKPDWAPVLDTLAELARNRGEFGTAISHLRKAVASSSTELRPAFQLRLATILTEAGRDSEARSILDELEGPDQPDAVRQAAASQRKKLSGRG